MAGDDTKEERVKLGLGVSQDEAKALEFVKAIHGDKYDGVASVLNDYSVADAVRVYKAAHQRLAVG